MEAASFNGNLISLAQASEVTGFNQDYLGFLARSGKLAAQKIGRNWITTRGAVNNLIASGSGILEVSKNRSREFAEPELLALKERAYRVREEQHHAAVQGAVERRLKKFENDFRVNLDSVVARVVAEKLPPNQTVASGQNFKHVAPVSFARAASAIDVAPASVNARAVGSGIDGTLSQAPINVERIRDSFNKNFPIIEYAVATAVCVGIVLFVALVCYSALNAEISQRLAPVPVSVGVN